jgi:hypothetical protein
LCIKRCSISCSSEKYPWWNMPHEKGSNITSHFRDQVQKAQDCFI